MAFDFVLERDVYTDLTYKSNFVILSVAKNLLRLKK
jgi:hypothetical protein